MGFSPVGNCKHMKQVGQKYEGGKGGSTEADRCPGA